ncbi:hypothetical protein [Nocardia sp. CY41]|uniref:hypothetical protein n=1 Tax=Nocardia sp. CY41 TaxID=2608686 RepID=UPI00135A3ADB|nr:hypothetical protein [Nocardia sp. CY41]
MTTVPGQITLIGCRRDRTIVPDPRVRYRPTPVGGRRYRPTLLAPRPRPAP